MDKMEDVELVIKMPKKLYEHIKNDNEYYLEDGEELYTIVKNGVPIPKGHGDLKDMSKICKPIPAEEDNCTGMGMSYDEMDAYNDGIDAMYSKVQDAPTIIEADDKEKWVNFAEELEDVFEEEVGK